MDALTHPATLAFAIDRARPVPLTTQITATLRTAILDGQLEPGARLPSWLDLAAQLGVSRGTVKAAYESLEDEFLVVPSGAAGTRVAQLRASKASATPTAEPIRIAPPLSEIEHGFFQRPLPFQMGVPAQDAFPAKLWARLRTRAVREDAGAPVGVPDPRGRPELRAQIAANLAITRGIHCHPDQVILTSGYKNGLCLTLLVLQLQGRRAWVEDPGYPIARMALEFAGLDIVPVPVDGEGLDIASGMALAPDAAVAIVTPGQQAPTGVTMSNRRRKELIAWAERHGGWIVEDDYLSELQLGGRAAPALMAGDTSERVIHVGTFGKTLSPALGLGFVVAPLSLAERFGEVAACLNPAPNLTTQLAVADFIADGHFLRHLRQMKALYKARRDGLRDRLAGHDAPESFAGLAMVLRLPKGVDDVALSREAVRHGIAPAPLSVWRHDRSKADPGLLLCVTNLRGNVLDRACDTLERLIAGLAPPDTSLSTLVEA